MSIYCACRVVRGYPGDSTFYSFAHVRITNDRPFTLRFPCMRKHSLCLHRNIIALVSAACNVAYPVIFSTIQAECSPLSMSIRLDRIIRSDIFTKIVRSFTERPYRE